MNKRTTQTIAIAFLMMFLSVNAFAQKNKKNKKEEAKAEIVLKNKIDSVSYGVGMNMALNLKKDFSEANIDAIIMGIKDGMENENTYIDVDEMRPYVMAFFKAKSDSVNNIKLKEYEKIAKDGLAFLEENKNKDGVQVTESGLQYIVLTEGTGKTPTATSSVTVHYQGTTPEGTIFDSSINRGKPATFGLNQVIKGWTEGLQLMKEGAKYRFFIPQQLAYGSNPPQNGEGPIKKFMPLVFEVELISVND